MEVAECAKYGHEKSLDGACIWCHVPMPVMEVALTPPVIATPAHVHEIGCRTGNVYYCGTCGQDLATLGFCMWIQQNFDQLVMEANAVTEAH